MERGGGGSGGERDGEVGRGMGMDVGGRREAIEVLLGVWGRGYVRYYTTSIPSTNVPTPFISCSLPPPIFFSPSPSLHPN